MVSSTLVDTPPAPVLGDRKLNPIVYLDLATPSRQLGRLTIELRADVCPKTCNNFRALCTGELGTSERSNKLRCYRGCKFTRITKDYNCQSGDFVNNDGTGGESIYDSMVQFKDENFILRHTGPGVLSMVNTGPDSNTSRFYISFVETKWLDERHVVFGYVMGADSLNVIRAVEALGSECGKPLEEVVIEDCGQLYP